MATLWDTTKVLGEFGNAFDISRVEAAAPSAATPTASAQTAAAPTRTYEVGKKVGQALGGSGGWLSRLLGKVPGLGLGLEAASNAAEGDTAGAVARGAVAAAGLGLGAPGRALATGFSGGELAAQGVASFADAMNPQSSVLTPAFATEVNKAGGASKYASDIQAKMQAEADAAAAKSTAERTARVNQVIADSQAAGKQSDADVAANDRMERRMMIENAIAKIKAPDAALFKGGFNTLGELFAQTAQYASKRGQLNRLAKQEFAADEKALDRENALSINSAKIQSEFLKAMKPDYKLGTVKSLTGEQPVVFQNGQPTTTVSIDDKGRVSVQPVAARPTTAQAHAEARAAIASSSNKAFTKQQVNQRLKEQGYPTLP